MINVKPCLYLEAYVPVVSLWLGAVYKVAFSLYRIFIAHFVPKNNIQEIIVFLIYGFKTVYK